MPVANRSRLTSGYGWQAWRNYTHTGLDFGGITPGQSSPVYAVHPGVVEFVGWDLIPLRRGQHIGIRHPDGSLTFYGHVRYTKVRKGQKVARGERLADTWYTGLSASAGVHLHFEWWNDHRNHYSHHDPTAKLARYGWVIRDGRLYDDRSTNQAPVTTKPKPKPKPTPVIPKEWSDMASKEEIESVVRSVVREEIAADRAKKAVRWPQADGSGYSNFTQDQSLGYLGEHWKRETARDTAKEV